MRRRRETSGGQTSKELQCFDLFACAALRFLAELVISRDSLPAELEVAKQRWRTQLTSMSRESGNNIIRQDSFSSMNQSGPLTFEPRVCSLANRGLGLEARSLRNESICLTMEICLREWFWWYPCAKPPDVGGGRTKAKFKATHSVSLCFPNERGLRSGVTTGEGTGNYGFFLLLLTNGEGMLVGWHLLLLSSPK
ncbi:hypothetical protein CEXT_756521 [Caerostris extrusa]|uniref:Uncharacterized protein n=1 Tax=Caerostris extrusa TaxID=172846 RepID=A0AAV4UGF3_CAEEX|nr:hypothetical protein CEXT_756521 [Caerostris extrusa]